MRSASQAVPVVPVPFGFTISFWRVNGWEATAGGQLFTHGSVEVFHIDDFMGATGTLEALLGDAVVASDSFTIQHDDPQRLRSLHPGM